MALSSATVWEVRTTGSDANGGGFVAGASGTDYSQQDAAQASGTNLAIDAATATKVTSATHNFVAADVGNLIQITAGSGFTAGFYQIVSVASNAATLDRSAGTLGSTGGTFAVGGALASPGKAAGALVTGNSVWMKAGTYPITSASTNVAGGCVSLTVSGSGLTALSYWHGYATTRWTATTGSPSAADRANPPLLQASGIATATLFNVAGQFWVVKNLAFDGASLTSIRGFANNNVSNNQYWYLTARNCTNTGIYLAQSLNVDAYGLEASGCSTAGAGLFLEWVRAYLCSSHDNSGIPGILTGGAGNNYVTLVACLAYANSGAGGHGFSCPDRVRLVNCTAYGNGGDGVRLQHQFGQAAINCISYGNSGYGFNASGGATNFIALLNCATGSNTSGATNNIGGPQPGAVALTVNPFVAAGSGNFALNSTAGGGAACKAAGIPGAYPGGLTTGYLDIGAAQSAAPGGGLRLTTFTGGING